MAKKYKLTGCARFLIFLVIVVPVVYFGVSYFTGNDPMAPLNKIEMPEFKKKPGNVSEKNIVDEALKVKDDRIKSLENKVEDLETIISQQKEEIKRLRNQ